MLTAFWLLVKNVAGGVLAALFKLLTEYPKQTAAVVLLAVAGYFSYNWAHDRGVAAGKKAAAEEVAKQLEGLQTKIDDLETENKTMREDIDKYNKEIEEKNKKIKELEKDSSKEAQDNKKRADELQTALAKLRGEYQASVKDANTWKTLAQNREVLLLERGSSKGPIEVRVQDNKVVCDQYYDEYTKTINSMVREVNKKIGVSK